MSCVSSRAWAPKAELSLQAPPSWISSHPPRRVIAVAISPKTARLAGPNFQSPSSAAEMPATPSTSRRKSAAKPETPRDLKGKKLLVPREVFPKVPSQPFSGRSVNFGRDRGSHKARAGRRRHAHCSRGSGRAAGDRRRRGAPQPSRQLFCASPQEKVPASFVGWEARVTGADRVHDDGLHLNVRFDVRLLAAAAFWSPNYRTLCACLNYNPIWQASTVCCAVPCLRLCPAPLPLPAGL
jgi:hypothetical protein